MDLILLKRVENLGELGDHVKVKSGYGRNFLIPQGKAARATPENMAEYEARRAELEQEAKASREQADARKSKLEELGEVTITAKTGTEGKLYGSIGTADVAEAVTSAGVDIERSEVRLPEEGPLRSAGEHTVELHIYADINVPFKVIVTGEE